MYKNTITSENTPNDHKAVVVNQINDQLVKAADEDTTEEQLQAIKDHFKWLLANDFYKNECSAEQITSMESYLPANYKDGYEDLPS
tara:strand:+ start:304 stop:561 length:258 start_codon:yes stop_codon:yes gene_type:complete